MKSRMVWQWPVWLGLAILAVGGGCRQATPGASHAAATQQATNTSPITAPATVAEADAAPEAAITDAPFQSISTDSPLPPAVRSVGPVAEVIKMANAGVATDTMLAIINNSPSPFMPSADEIIYLNDLGVPGNLITAMLQRDEFLKEAIPEPMPLPQVAGAQPAAPVPQPAVPPPYAGINPAPPAPPAETDTPPALPAETVDSGFYDTLAPYGSWVDVTGCGPCWQPAVAVANPAWQPYVDGGRWVCTDAGWYWLSDYSWGWAAFHYGRWFRHHQLGWC